MKHPKDHADGTGFEEERWQGDVRRLVRDSDSRAIRRLVGLRRWAEVRLAPITTFSRIAEFEVAREFLDLKPGLSVLDLASPKFFGLALSRRYRLEIRLTDIWPDEVSCWRAWAEGAGWSGPKVHFETADARSTSYRRATFDRVFSISVVEHIPGDGDILALKEVGRLLKPGGIAVISVPYSGRFKEWMTASHFYGVDNPEKEERLFARIYDKDSLQDRLVRPSGLKLEAAAALGIRPSVFSGSFAANLRLSDRPMGRRLKLIYFLTLPFSPLFPRLSKAYRFRADPFRLPASTFTYDIVLKLRKKA